MNPIQVITVLKEIKYFVIFIIMFYLKLKENSFNLIMDQVVINLKVFSLTNHLKDFNILIFFHLCN